MQQLRLRRSTAANAKQIALGSDDDVDQGDGDDEDEALLSENPGSQHSRRRHSTRNQRGKGAESKLSPAIEDLQVGNPPDVDPLYELKIVTLYEHSQRRGHKICAYRGCRDDETVEGDESAFAQSGEPRKLFKWLHKRTERELRKEVARKAIPKIAEGSPSVAEDMAADI